MRQPKCWKREVENKNDNDNAQSEKVTILIESENEISGDENKYHTRKLPWKRKVNHHYMEKKSKRTDRATKLKFQRKRRKRE